jgi:DNA polymerase III epsilon subunit-like protein
MKYVSIDIETTGIDPELDQVIEIGAVIDNLSNPQPINKLRTYRKYVVNKRYSGNPYALWLNSQALKNIHDRNPSYTYLPPEDIAESLFSFLSSEFPIKQNKVNLVVAGKNFGSFDKLFLTKLPKMNELISFGHRAIDPAMLYFDPKIDTELPSSKLCMERAGLAGEVAHTAVEDAIMIIKLIRNYYKIPF